LDSPILSIIIPAHNEKWTLGGVLKRAKETIKSLDLPSEIIVIDDGSTDETLKIVYLSSEAGIIVLRNDKNYGKGYALRRGIKYSKGKIVVTMDADGSHKPEELPFLLKPIFDDADMVIGSRFKGKIERGAIKRINILGNKLINLLIYILTRKKLTDALSGFRAVKREFLSKVDLYSDGYEIEAEITVKLIKTGCRIREIPISCVKPVRSSYLNSFRDGYKIIKTIFKAYRG